LRVARAKGWPPPDHLTALSQPSVPEACGDGRMRQSQRKHVPARAAGVKVRKKIPLALADTDKSISNSNKSIDSIIYNNLDFNQRSAKLFSEPRAAFFTLDNRRSFSFSIISIGHLKVTNT
jgi:hypothetical protein